MNAVCPDGRGRSARGRLRRHRRRGARHWDCPQHHRAGAGRSGSTGLAAGPGPSCRQRAQARAGQGSDAPGGSAPPGRAGNPWRSNAAAAVGFQESHQARGRTVCDGPPDQPEHGRQAAAGGTGLLPADQPQDPGGRPPSRSRQPVRPHQRPGLRLPGGRPAGDLGRHQEARSKKKELIGPFKNGGSDDRPKGSPEAVNVHDFADKTLGKVAPYGIYDPLDNHGWVSLGIDHDTAEFAVNAIRTWHERIGRVRYRGSDRLLITADCGGSNGARVRLWKVELQKLADETGLAISVCHYPPGTSKWNKIEHRLFCHITQNWRGRPLISHAAVVDLIAATTTTSGLTVDCVLDPRRYAKGIKISDEKMACLNIQADEFHPEWNYTIAPRAPQHPTCSP